MPLYVVVESKTGGRLRQSVTQKDVEPIGTGETLEIVPDVHAPPDELKERWDAATKRWVPIVAPAAQTPSVLTRADLAAMRDTFSAAVAQIDAVLLAIDTAAAVRV